MPTQSQATSYVISSSAPHEADAAFQQIVELQRFLVGIEPVRGTAGLRNVVYAASRRSAKAIIEVASGVSLSRQRDLHLVAITSIRRVQGFLSLLMVSKGISETQSSRARMFADSIERLLLSRLREVELSLASLAPPPNRGSRQPLDDGKHASPAQAIRAADAGTAREAHNEEQAALIDAAGTGGAARGLAPPGSREGVPGCLNLEVQ